MKAFPRILRFWTALILVAWLGFVDASPAAAGLAPSRASATSNIDSPRAADLVIAQRALENKVVAQKLRDYGVAPEEAKARLVTMSDRDLHTLASASKGLPSGGDAAGGLIGLLIVILLVIVILKLLNHDVIVR